VDPQIADQEAREPQPGAVLLLALRRPPLPDPPASIPPVDRRAGHTQGPDLTPARDQPMTQTLTAPGRHPAMFLLLFALFYGAFYGAYFAVPDRLLVNEVYEPTLVAPSGLLVNLISASEQATWADNRLQSRRAILDVVRGCDGIGLLLLLTAAVLAFPAPWRLKLAGVVGGWLLMYLLNLARIVGLYFVVAYQGQWFIPLHTLLIPGALVLLGGLYFHLWTAWVVGQGSHERA